MRLTLDTLVQRELRAGLQTGHGCRLRPHRGDDPPGDHLTLIPQLPDPAQHLGVTGPIPAQRTGPGRGRLPGPPGGQLYLAQLHKQQGKIPECLHPHFDQLGRPRFPGDLHKGPRPPAIRVRRARRGPDPVLHGGLNRRKRIDFDQYGQLVLPHQARLWVLGDVAIEDGQNLGQPPVRPEHPFERQNGRRRPGLHFEQLPERRLRLFQLTARLLRRRLPEHPVLQPEVGSVLERGDGRRGRCAKCEHGQGDRQPLPARQPRSHRLPPGPGCPPEPRAAPFSLSK